MTGGYSTIRPAAIALTLSIILQCLIGTTLSQADDLLERNTWHRRLPNGIEAIVVERPESELVAVSVAIGGGVRTEGTGAPVGTAHATEHMLFQGTSHRTQLEIEWQIEALGGRLNAWTGKESMNVHVLAPAGEYRAALDMLADIVLRSNVPLERFEHEQRVLQQEQLDRASRPREVAVATIAAEVFTDHPLARPIGADSEALSALSVGTVLDYQKRNIVTENLTIAVVGGVPVDEAFAGLAESFADTPRGQRPVIEPVPVTMPATQRRVHIPFDSEQSYLVFGFPAPGSQNPETVALRALAPGLTGSVLYSDLVSIAGMASDVFGDYQEFSDAGIVYFAAAVDPDSVPYAIQIIEMELRRIQSTLLPQYIVDNWTSLVLRGSVVDRETVLQHAMILADGIHRGTYVPADQYAERLAAVTSDDMRSIARKYLEPAKATIIVVGPTPGFDWKP